MIDMFGTVDEHVAPPAIHRTDVAAHVARRPGQGVRMERAAAARARARRGVVLTEDFSERPVAAGRRRGLVQLLPGAYVAETQPVDAQVLVAALGTAVDGTRYAVMEEAALWLHGMSAAPSTVVIGVPLGRGLAVRGGVQVRRVSASVLAGSRLLQQCSVVALEVAVIQVAARWTHEQVTELVADAVRSRRTTVARLRARCRRGLKGSARVRAVCDELSGGSMDADVRRLQAALTVRGVTGLETEVRFVSAGGPSAYADLFHRESLTAFEVDGFVHHSRRQQFRTDRRRDRWLRRDHQVLTVRVDVSEIREDVDALADELVPFVLRTSTRDSA